MPYDNGSRPWQYWRDRALQSFTTLLLTLFLPLSFLLLLRVSAAHYSHFHDFDSTPCHDFLTFLFLYANSTILYALLALISLSAFVHAFTRSRLSLIQRLFLSTHPQQENSPAAVNDNPRRGTSLSLGGLLIIASLVLVELGVEFELNGTDPPSGRERSILASIRGVLLVVGLYETMLYWSKSVVKPVVEDTLTMMGCSSSKAEEEIKIRWVDRVGLGVSFGVLWWWRLRDQVDSLAADDHVADFVGLGLYYLTVSIGVVRAFTAVMWVGTAMAVPVAI